MAILGLALAAALALIRAGPAHQAVAQAPPHTLDEYAQVVGEAVGLLVLTGGSPEERLDLARQHLASIEMVVLPSGALVPVAPLLPADEVDLTPDDAEARLAAVHSQLTAAAHDRTAARLALLDQVLARPEFAVQESPWQRFRRWLAKQLARWLPDVAPAGERSQAVDVAAEALVWAVGAVGLLLLAGLLGYWLQGLLHSFVVDTELAAGRDRLGQSTTPEQARTEATAFARAGNYRAAVRQLYLAALLTLEERGLVQHNRSLTNREVLAQVRPAAELAGHLTPVVDTFDAVWYGVQEPTQDTYRSYAAEIDALTDAARRDPHTRQQSP